MANLTASLAQDNYQSTLSQAYNWAVGTMYVKNTPTVTFPAGKKVFLTINPEKSNMQVVRVSARDSALKTITDDSIDHICNLDTNIIIYTIDWTTFNDLLLEYTIICKLKNNIAEYPKQ